MHKPTNQRNVIALLYVPAYVWGAMAIVAPAAQGSNIFLLPPPAGYTNTEGMAINTSGQVAATLYKGTFGSTPSATALYSGGAFVDIAAGNGLGNGSSFAAAINDSGAQVGSYFPGVQSSTAVLISPAGSLTNLANLYVNVTSHGSQAQAINNSGTIAGSSYTTNNGAEHPVKWNSTGTVVTDLGTIAGGGYGSAFGINATGVIVGTAGATSANLTNGKGFVYSGGVMSAIAGLSGASDAYAINNSGQIVGDETIGGNLHAFLDTGGTIIDLGTLGGATSAAFAINSFGQVVGYADTATGSDAFLYSAGKMIDLNTLLPQNSGWVLQTANGINDAGYITGYGLHNGQEEGFVLSPEPRAIVLSAIGFCLIILISLGRRRRGRHRAEASAAATRRLESAWRTNHDART